MTAGLARPLPGLGSAVRRAAGRVGRAAGFWYRFIRFPVIGATGLLPLIGAATVSSHLSGRQLAGLLGVAGAFHLYAYVLNDVADLPVDRSEPLRASYPLVDGTIQPWQALAFALLQIPLALAVTAWQGGGAAAYAALAASFGLMTVYDVWGKRLRCGPLTDVIQGLGWGAYVLYGALLAAGQANRLTLLAAAFVVVFIILINGVHGSLRDLANDLACGLRSTAILLGARPQGEGIVVPRRLRVYALGLQVVLLAILFAAVPAGELGYGPAARAATAALLAALALASLFWLRAALAWAGDHRMMIVAGTLHMTLVLGSLIALLALAVEGRLLAVMLAVYLLPWLTHLEVLSGPLLGLWLLLSAAHRQRRYPLTAQAIRAAAGAWRQPATALGRAEALARLIRTVFDHRLLIRRLLAQDWAYVEQRLERLRRAEPFPLTPALSRRERVPQLAVELLPPAGEGRDSSRPPLLGGGELSRHHDHIPPSSRLGSLPLPRGRRDEAALAPQGRGAFQSGRLSRWAEAGPLPPSPAPAKKHRRGRGAPTSQLVAVGKTAHDKGVASACVYDHVPAAAGALDPDYNFVRQAFLNLALSRTAFMLDSLAELQLEPRRVCQVGGGARLLWGDVLERYPQARGCGLGAGPAALAHARRVFDAWCLSGRAAWAAAGEWRLPFATGVFDLVIAADDWAQHPQPPAGLREWARVLRPGGCLISAETFSAAAATPGLPSAGEWAALHQAAGFRIAHQCVEPIGEARFSAMLAGVRI